MFEKIGYVIGAFFSGLFKIKRRTLFEIELAAFQNHLQKIDWRMFLAFCFVWTLAITIVLSFVMYSGGNLSYTPLICYIILLFVSYLLCKPRIFLKTDDKKIYLKTKSASTFISLDSLDKVTFISPDNFDEGCEMTFFLKDGSFINIEERRTSENEFCDILSKLEELGLIKRQ